MGDLFAGGDGSLWERVPNDDPDQLMVYRELARQLREEAQVHLEALREVAENLDNRHLAVLAQRALEYRAKPKES
jgi:hypothetical protein